MITTMHSRAGRTFIVSLSLAAVSLTAKGQSLESRIAAARGSVGFEFTTKENVCGNGSSISISDDISEGWTRRSRRSGIHIGRRSSGDNGWCEQGPARVILEHTGSKVSRLRVTVGGREHRADSELGAVAAPEAAKYLLAIAPALSGESADDAIMGAAIADSAVVWKRMIEIARDNNASEKSRKSSMFWVSHEASAAATAGLDSVASDDDAEISVRKDALFFLAQRPDGQGIPGLIKVVETSQSRTLRKDAIWHLSQSHDPRAIALFEKILAGK